MTVIAITKFRPHAGKANLVLQNMKEDDLLILTGDHGTDPTDGKTDHSYSNGC